MNVTRRSLLVAGASAPMVGALAGTASAAPRARSSSAGRAVPLRDGWRFALVDPGGITDPTGAYADAARARLRRLRRGGRSPSRTTGASSSTPTTEHGTTSGTGFFPGGLGWYRIAFTLPPALAGKRISVEFDGVYMDSYVYCNGTEVGRHPYGYTGFALDLTDLLHTDGTTENVIAVKVQNRLPSSRWYSGSGIYREARLVVTEPVHVARWGTHVTTPEITEDRALVRVRTSVVNASGAAADVRGRLPRSSTRAAAPSPVPPPRSRSATGTATETHELAVRRTAGCGTSRPRTATPWRPNCASAAERVDTYRTPFGIRTFRFDPDEGFHLNGTHHKIKGVDLHHDLGALGAAVSADAIRRQMTIMKSMGVNAFRTSHNPPSPEMIEVCEELGIVMMVEAFDCWRTGKTRYDYGRFFDEWADARRHRDGARGPQLARRPAVVDRQRDIRLHLHRRPRHGRPAHRRHQGRRRHPPRRHRLRQVPQRPRPPAPRPT